MGMGFDDYRGSWIQDPGSKTQDPEAWGLHPGSRIQNPGAWVPILDPGTRILDRDRWACGRLSPMQQKPWNSHELYYSAKQELSQALPTAKGAFLCECVITKGHGITTRE